MVLGAAVAVGLVLLALVVGFLVRSSGSGTATRPGASGLTAGPTGSDASTSDTRTSDAQTSASDPPSSDPAEVARVQAAAVEALLDQSASGRGLIGPAVQQLGDCNGSIAPSDAVNAISQAEGNRARLVSQAGQLAVDALSGGAQLKALLQSAWSLSLRADQGYLAWARGIAAGGPCSGQAPAKLASDAVSAQATAAKKTFVDAWNAQVAAPLGLATRQEASL